MEQADEEEGEKLGVDLSRKRSSDGTGHDHHGLAQELGIRGSCLPVAGQFREGGRAGLERREADRREVNRRSFPRHHQVQLNCESPS